ncbi:MAG: hypothetical protein WB760_16375 [Xanthobacteraceae bacterium]
MSARGYQKRHADRGAQRNPRYGLGFMAGRELLRIDSIGIVPKPRIAMQSEHWNVNARAGCDLHSAAQPDRPQRRFEGSEIGVDEHAKALSW